MKTKCLVLFLLVSLSGMVSAQVIERHGDRYTVGDVTYATSTSFRNYYLKPNNPELFSEYDKGYKLAVGGWTMFSFGIVSVPISTFMLFINQDATSVDPNTGEQVVHTAFPPEAWFAGWLSCALISSAAICASIPMLGVGYHKMHQSVDSYNAKQQPLTYWSFDVRANEIGFTYHF